jgi:tRNA G18 (ribose-2'-O)-methylase SpoU
MNDNDLVPLFVEQGGTNLYNFGFAKDVRYCLVLGNEYSGIPKNILALIHEIPGSAIISIPMIGMVRSLNVGIAAGMVMSELNRKVILPQQVVSF